MMRLPMLSSQPPPASRLALAAALCGLVLAGCAGGPAPAPAVPDSEAWQAFALPGKSETRYTAVVKDGRPAIAAVSEGSASMWRRRVDSSAPPAAEVSFSWWVPALPARASVADGDREDAAVRVMFGFQGDFSTLSARTRMQFELAQALTGERPPYATLMYVWDAEAPVGTVIINGRSDRIRKIVVDSGTAQLGRWRDHRRDLRADFRLAFGEDPGPLSSIALMTDSDNTRGQARAWYGPVNLYPQGLLRPCTAECKP